MGKFCKDCGRQTIKGRTDQYDIYTGESIQKDVCSNWWCRNAVNVGVGILLSPFVVLFLFIIGLLIVHLLIPKVYM